MAKISKCCGAKIEYRGGGYDGEELCPIENYCSKCHKPCDTIDQEEEGKKEVCCRCGYEVAEYRHKWGKVLCQQCNLDYDSPSQEELESRI